MTILLAPYILSGHIAEFLKNWKVRARKLQGEPLFEIKVVNLNF